MYTLESMNREWVVKHTEKHEMIGPFTSQGDGYLIVELLNSGKMRLELNTHGEESS